MFKLGDLVISKNIKENFKLEEVTKAVSLYEELALREKKIESYEMEFYKENEISFVISTSPDYSRTIVVTPKEYSQRKLENFFLSLSTKEVVNLKSVIEDQMKTRNAINKRRIESAYKIISELENLKIMYDSTKD